MEKVITANNTLHFDWRELWTHRELFYFFAWRDIRLRYQHVLLGALWTILQPLAFMLVLTIVLHEVLPVFSKHIPYSIFAFIGLLFWTYFASSLTRSSNSLVANHALITKAPFPRLILPLSSLVVGLVDFVLVFLVLLVIMAFYHTIPGVVGIILLIPCLFITMGTAFSLGLFFSFLQVKYRDVRQILPFVTSLLFFLTPVIYPIRILPPTNYQWISYINPLAGVIETMRAALLSQPVHWEGFFISLGSSLLLCFLGLVYFWKKEKELAGIL